MRILRSALVVAGLLGVGSALGAQQASAGACATPDSVAFRGNHRISDDVLRNDVGIAPKSTINARITSRAIKDLYATNQFDYVTTSCEEVGDKTLLVFHLRERRLLNDVKVTGPEKVSLGSVKDRVDVLIEKPIDPAQVARDVARIDSLYQSEGYFLARVHVDTIVVNDTAASLVFRIDEGRRLAVSGVEIIGNKALSSGTIVGAISTKPEGFFWWRNGEFDQDKYTEDIGKTIPQLYASHGYIDAAVVHDTLIIDRDLGSWRHELDERNRPSHVIWRGKPDVYHAYQALLLARMPLAPVLSVQLGRDPRREVDL